MRGKKSPLITPQKTKEKQKKHKKTKITEEAKTSSSV